MPQSTVKDRVIAKIKRSPSSVFLRKEFEEYMKSQGVPVRMEQKLYDPPAD